MKGCINAGFCNCHCPRYCDEGAHCKHHSNGCHLECPEPEVEKEPKEYRPPRRRDGEGKYTK